MWSSGRKHAHICSSLYKQTINMPYIILYCQSIKAIHSLCLSYRLEQWPDKFRNNEYSMEIEHWSIHTNKCGFTRFFTMRMSWNMKCFGGILTYIPPSLYSCYHLEQNYQLTTTLRQYYWQHRQKLSRCHCAKWLIDAVGALLLNLLAVFKTNVWLVANSTESIRWYSIFVPGYFRYPFQVFMKFIESR